ncbi:tetratricopeptide repeat protein [Shewanella gelidimarina]|uniref:tetratricopeptide repeat protein n=1 Tax=Shewanella gelidimarina TaxID=56813 RepID=UPI00200FAAAC|nr:tetratricopeptide repeat protein [Shewanella gelidimarina]MCL1057023.1 tetratricopeptide repeat protein [Shewanella gelidimarina]
MRSVLTLLLIILFSCISNCAHAIARNDVDTEHKFRESPNSLRQSINNNLPTLPDFTNKEALNRYAMKNGLSLAELKFELQLLARLSLDLSTKNDDRYTVARTLIDQLELVADNDFDKSYILMLNGRYIGKTKQDFKSAIAFYQQAITTLSANQSVKVQVLRFTLHENIGVMQMMLREDESALAHLKSAQAVALEIADPYMIAHAESVLGKYYYKKGQYGKSLSHYSEAIKHTKADENPTQDAHIQMQLARVYRSLKSWDDALRYATAASAIYQRLGKEVYVAASMTVIAMTYGEQEQWYKAIDYYLNAQQIDAKLGNYIGQALTLHNLGEAYFKIGDTKTSISNLLRASAIFSSRNSDHYLVYNHLLLAEVFNSISDWEPGLKYAESATRIAEQMKLDDELIQALTLSSAAQQHLGQFEKAYHNINKILNLRSKDGNEVNDDQQVKLLFQLQTAKLELNQKDNDLQREEGLLSTNRLMLIFCLLALALTSIMSIYLWRIKNNLTAKCTKLVQISSLNPFTKTSNYSAYIQDFTYYSNTFKTLALISLTDQLNSDLAQGYSCNAKMNKQQIDSLSGALNCQVYIIRPGLFLLSFDIKVAPDTLLSNIKSALNDNYGDTCLHMGLLSLPLLADPALKISAQQHFGTLQMMLSAAITLGNQQNYYVTLKPLNFASSGIFEPPLYLNIEKSIIRGIIKIETNGIKGDIVWPRWKSHQNVDLTAELS